MPLVTRHAQLSRFFYFNFRVRGLEASGLQLQSCGQDGRYRWPTAAQNLKLRVDIVSSASTLVAVIDRLFGTDAELAALSILFQSFPGPTQIVIRLSTHRRLARGCLVSPPLQVRICLIPRYFVSFMDTIFLSAKPR